MCHLLAGRSAEELGTHAAMCFGTDGLDPAFEGLTGEGIELLVSGGDGTAEEGSAMDPDADEVPLVFVLERSDISWAFLPRDMCHVGARHF